MMMMMLLLLLLLLRHCHPIVYVLLIIALERARSTLRGTFRIQHTGVGLTGPRLLPLAAVPSATLAG